MLYQLSYTPASWWLPALQRRRSVGVRTKLRYLLSRCDTCRLHVGQNFRNSSRSWCFTRFLEVV